MKTKSNMTKDKEKKIKNEAQEFLEKTLFELDVFNASVLATLIYKKVITKEEFEEIKKQIRPIVNKQSKEAKDKMEKLMKLNDPIKDLINFL